MLTRLFKKSKAPKATIVMRTRDRTLFLPRALDSVLAQSFSDWHLVILDDNADPKPTKEILRSFQNRFNGRMEYIHVRRAPGKGLGFLLNVGIRATKSEFIAVHDDDDTWDPHFLTECLAQIGTHTALVTQSTLVTEYADQESIQEHSRAAYNAWQKHAISLFRLAEGVTFPTISFFFRRSVWEELGGFDESLPHKEDWEFSLRLLAKYPVFLLEKPLAFFHYRANDYVEGAGNLVRDHGAHFAAETEVRNKFLRSDLTSGTAGLGFLTNLSFSKGALFKEILSVGSVLQHVVTPQIKAKKVEGKQPLHAPHDMHIAFAADEKFALPLTVALRSLIENRKVDGIIHLHIVDGGIAVESKERILQSLPASDQIKISWLHCDWTKFRHLPLRERFSPAVYGRILLPELLDASVEKVLYLDSDTLILDDLSELYGQDCQEFALLAAQDFVGWFNSPALGITGLDRFGIPGEAKYFNSGVLLLNLRYWREHQVTKTILSFMEKNPDSLHMGDQSPINICLYGKIGELDYGWNFQLPDRNVREGSWHFGTIKVPNTKPRIVHFVSEEKPWLSDQSRPYASLYRDYAARTAWQNGPRI